MVMCRGQRAGQNRNITIGKPDVRESVHRDITMNTTNEMQLYRLIYYS